jgi:hypothetical protein
MNTNFNQGSARIYQFPVGGRSGLVVQRQDEIRTSTENTFSRVTAAAVGGAWYHDEAIEESKPVREH